MYKNRKIMITGSVGTVGRALAKKLALEDPKEIVGLDHNEAGLFDLEQDLKEQISTVMCDVRDGQRLIEVTKNINILFHCAALKHVPLCERNPSEAIRTNIDGVRNIIAAAEANDIERVIFTSSDKAVNPFNVMGTSKLMGEYLFRAANIVNADKRFVSTRFGNVLGSRGSVIPIFHRQIREKGPVTVTSNQMTRFVMSLDEAVNLVLAAGAVGVGGEIVVGKMRAIDIRTLAEVMIDRMVTIYGYKNDEIEIIETGAREGEKLYEELMNSEEVRRSVELDNHHVILPPFSDLYPNIASAYSDKLIGNRTVAYNSQNEKLMSRSSLERYLEKSNLFLEENGRPAY